MAAAGTIVPRISAIHDFQNYAAALTELTSRTATGKVLLRVTPD